MSGPSLRFPMLGLSDWLRPILVVTGCACGCPENNQDDETDQWDESDKPPPPAATGVVQPANHQPKRWQENNHSPDQRDEAQATDHSRGAN